ncbi:hypothetical protein X928_01930 [Petrotoga miotherma DSM 10691]|uniref:Uncharacterized protein n=3 Tax=Petrotogaceae TaxID=1643949 RepID=A0A2K1PGQ5_9BACT|nr:hypothetical protein X928_01930 [Petrotoga miotherma DSM 10691]POZ90052.1 hypothetical protein AA81_11885 [Petrotoga halophila DSM 16923]
MAIKYMNDSNLVHEDHLHPEVILWVNFSEESKKEFLEKIKELDEELAQDINEHLSQFKVQEEVVPVNLPLDVDSEEEFDNFMYFLGELAEIVDLKAYSVITEVSLAEEESEKEDSGDLYDFPAIFSEEKEGSCYLTVFDWDLKEMEEYSGKFEKNEKEIEGLRFPFFQS